MPRTKKTQAVSDNLDWETEEEEAEAPSSFTVEFKPESAVTQKFVYLRVSKTWGQVQLLGEFPLKSGITFMEPYNTQIIVAWTRPGKEQVEEELRPDAILWEEWEKLTQAMEACQQRALGRVYASEATKPANGF